jgi:DNA-directed RNA polymerase specialized sigma24 family protein
MIIEHNALTGETIEREATAEEIAQAAIDAEVNAGVQAAKDAIAEAAASAVSKLESLGLTPEEIAAILA